LNKDGSANDMMVANMKAALEALPWIVADSTDMISSQIPSWSLVSSVLRCRNKGYYKMAGEFRADQFLEITTGIRLERFTDKLQAGKPV
jgi:hypothetical protein